MIEDQYKIRKTFMNSGRRFLLDSCVWKPVQKQIKKNHSLLDYNHFKRYLPSTIVYQNSFYIYGGALVKVPNQRMLYSLNIRTGQWHGWKSQSQIDQRNSHSCTVFQNGIYFFGGNNHDIYFNDIRKFQPNFNRWSIFQSQGDKPKPRDRAYMTTYNGSIFVYGGYRMNLNNTNANGSNKSKLDEENEGGQFQVLEQGYLWKDCIWTKLNSIDAPQKRINPGFTKCGQQIFMYGGQSVGQSQEYFDDVYQIIIDEQSKQMRFIKQIIKSDISPIARSSHCMIGISQTTFLVYGGQTYSQQKQKQNTKQSENNKNVSKQNHNEDLIFPKNLIKVLRDIWIYNINQCQWTSIQPKNGPFLYLTLASCAIYQNIIYVFGGIDGNGVLNNELYQLTFAQDQIMKTEICAGCQERQKKRIQQSKNLPKKPLISIGFIYNIALQIKFPFQAISLLTDSAILLKAKNINLTVMKGPSEFKYLDFQFDGQSIKKDEFMAFVSHSYNKQTKRVRQLIDKIKLGSFRLGKTFLFISADHKTRKVIMLSADSRITPMFDERYTYYAYVEDIQTGTIQTQEGVNHRNFIQNILKAYVVSVNFILCCKNKNSLLVFTNNSVTTKSKDYYSELHSYTIQDFKLYKNPKKLQFLDNLGYNISKDPEVSLASYLQIAYDSNKEENKFKFTINEIQNSVVPLDYKSHLQKLSLNKIITKISPEQLYQNYQLPKYVNFSLYTYYQNQPIQKNQGILIYYNGRLINRFGYQFGNIFFQKFYKSKYKKAQSLYTLLGIIQITQQEQQENQSKIGRLELNIYENGFKNNFEYKRLISKLQKIVTDYKNPKEMINLIEEDQDQLQIQNSRRISRGQQQQESKSHKKVKLNQ